MVVLKLYRVLAEFDSFSGALGLLTAEVVELTFDYPNMKVICTSQYVHGQ